MSKCVFKQINSLQQEMTWITCEWFLSGIQSQKFRFDQFIHEKHIYKKTQWKKVSGYTGHLHNRWVKQIYVFQQRKFFFVTTKGELKTCITKSIQIFWLSLEGKKWLWLKLKENGLNWDLDNKENSEQKTDTTSENMSQRRVISCLIKLKRDSGMWLLFATRQLFHDKLSQWFSTKACEKLISWLWRTSYTLTVLLS